MKNQSFISVVIPVEKKTVYLEEALHCYSKQTYPNFEVIISSSTSLFSPYSFVRVVIEKQLSGDVASKRNQILRFGRGEIFVFNDDDVFVPGNYLQRIIEKFKDDKILAACGSLLTPEADSLYQKASGVVWESYLGSFGAGVYRSRKMPARTVYDYPAANLIVRKEVFQAVGGFEPGLYPGEDTKLCLLIFNKYKTGVSYDPKLFVYHHRKPLLKAHLRQVGRYGTQRGWFTLSYPETSFKIQYFFPSFLLLYLLFLVLFMVRSFLFGDFSRFFLLSLPFIAYLTFVIIECIGIAYKKGLKLIVFAAGGIVVTHLYYGYRFLKSFMGKIMQRMVEL